jgi:hypothetical protein
MNSSAVVFFCFPIQVVLKIIPFYNPFCSVNIFSLLFFHSYDLKFLTLLFELREEVRLNLINSNLS